jgi:small subunit ribosomal protein S8
LKYNSLGEPIIKEFRVTSKPGRRVSKGIAFFIDLSGNNLFILKTSLGVLSDYEAKKKKIGGEVLLKIVR